MDEAGWAIVVAFCGGFVIAAFIYGLSERRGRYRPERPSPALMREPNLAPQVTSIAVGDDDVLIFETPAGVLSEKNWQAAHDFLDNSIVGRFPEDLPEGRRRRTAMFPPGVPLRVLHIKRQARADGAASHADGNKLVAEER